MKSSILKIITPGDKILVIFILALGVFSLIGINHFQQAGDLVTIKVNGQVVQQLDLKVSEQVTVNGPIGKTTIKIDHGEAQVIYSDCPEKICVKTGKIRHVGEIIVCVPNKLVVKISSQEKNQFDAITQ